MVVQFLYPVLFGVVIFSIFLQFKRKKLLEKLNMPLIAGGIPFLGQALSMMKGSPWDLMTQWHYKYGGSFLLHLFGSDAACIADPDMLKIVLNKKMTIFRKDLQWTYKPFLVILGNGLVTAHGDDWRRQRSLLSSALRVDILTFIPDMALRATQRLVEKITLSRSSGKNLDMADEFRHLTLQVIAEAVLSLEPHESDNNFAHMYLPIVEEGNLRTWNPLRMFLPIPAWFKFNADVKRLNDYVTNLILNRKNTYKRESSTNSKNPKRDDILDIVIRAIDESEWNDAAVSQICDEIKTFILAGHETSASMLTWSLYELSKNKELLAKVRSEADSVYGTKCRSINDIIMPDRDELSKLVFSECCLRESLRKYSVVPSVVRVNSEEVDLGNNHILPTGTTVLINIQGVHHNEKYWPEPLEYRPERFLNPIEPYTFLPFVEGPRMCLGQFLSILESKIVLSLLVKFFNFETLNADAGEKHPFMVPIIPKTGHIMKITDR